MATKSKQRKKLAGRNQAHLVGPPKPFHVVVNQELRRNRVNVAFKALSLRSVSGCDPEARDHFQAIRRASEHNKRDDEHHHVPPGQIFRERSHLNECLRGPSTVDAVVDMARNIFEEYEIVPPRVDSLVCFEWVLFPGPLPDPLRFYEWANRLLEGWIGPVIESDRHQDQHADHAHTLALPIKDGRLAGNELSSGHNRFEILQRRFLEAAEREFTALVRAGHDRKGPSGGSAKGGPSSLAKGGFAKGGWSAFSRWPHTQGGSAKGDQAPPEHPYLRGSPEPPLQQLFTSLGIEQAGEAIFDSLQLVPFGPPGTKLFTMGTNWLALDGDKADSPRQGAHHDALVASMHEELAAAKQALSTARIELRSLLTRLTASPPVDIVAPVPETHTETQLALRQNESWTAAHTSDEPCGDATTLVTREAAQARQQAPAEQPTVAEAWNWRCLATKALNKGARDAQRRMDVLNLLRQTGVPMSATDIASERIKGLTDRTVLGRVLNQLLASGEVQVKTFGTRDFYIAGAQDRQGLPALVTA